MCVCIDVTSSLQQLHQKKKKIRHILNFQKGRILSGHSRWHLHCAWKFCCLFYSRTYMARFTVQLNWTCSQVSILQTGIDFGFSLYPKKKKGTEGVIFQLGLYWQHRIDTLIERNVYISVVYIIYKQYKQSLWQWWTGWRQKEGRGEPLVSAGLPVYVLSFHNKLPPGLAVSEVYVNQVLCSESGPDNAPLW